MLNAKYAAYIFAPNNGVIFSWCARCPSSPHLARGRRNWLSSKSSRPNRVDSLDGTQRLSVDPPRKVGRTGRKTQKKHAEEEKKKKRERERETTPAAALLRGPAAACLPAQSNNNSNISSFVSFDPRSFFGLLFAFFGFVLCFALLCCFVFRKKQASKQASKNKQQPLPVYRGEQQPTAVLS